LGSNALLQSSAAATAVSVKDDIPRSYVRAARPGMMLSKVALTTFALRPIFAGERLREIGVHPDDGVPVGRDELVWGIGGVGGHRERSLRLDRGGDLRRDLRPTIDTRARAEECRRSSQCGWRLGYVGYDGGRSWSAPIRINDNGGSTEALQPNLDVAPNGTVAVAFYDRRLPCPAQGTPQAARAGLAFDPGTAASPGTPYGRANYCVNTAVQFYAPDLRPKGHNVRLSSLTWDPELSALRPSCICSPGTFIGDYFGVASASGSTYTASVSTANYAGENPSFHQQQVVAHVSTP
jgi:hypothetical protein